MSTFRATPLPPKQNYFLSQPHQPFFVFGLLWAIVSMVLFVLSHKGIITLSISENQFHLYSLAFLVFAQFFHGFLFTTFPRFCSTMPIPKEAYIRIIWLYQIGSVLFFAGSLLSEWLALFAMVAVLFAHSMAVFALYWIYKIGQSPAKQDPFWILVAHGITLITHLLWIIAFGISLIWNFQNWFALIPPIIVNFFFVFLTFSVAQRMIPFFSHSHESKTKYFVEAVFGAFIVKTLFALIAFTAGEAIVGILLSLYLLREFLQWKLHPFNSPAIIWILHLALFWLPVGLLIGSLIQIIEMVYNMSFLFAEIHLLALGFLTTILIGFGTRVTLGHSGQSPEADKVSIVLFWWTQVVILARFALSVDTAFGGSHPWLFDAAACGWILLFIVWGGRYGKTLIFGKK
ncbi:MAG: NnrS family protein [Sulfuricurvum sp.]|nr:NnrS family protein [Sulfuricurvum sp.]